MLAVGLVAGLLPWTGPDREPTPVDGTGSAGAIPSRLVTPPPRLGGTADDPIGRLAVIAGAERRRRWWFGGSTIGTVAVSAVTGEYRFLDPRVLAWSSDDELVLAGLRRVVPGLTVLAGAPDQGAR